MNQRGGPAEEGLYYGWVIVAVSFVVMVFASPVLATVSIFYVAIYNDFGWSRADTALAMSIFMVVNAFGSPISGSLIDRFNARWVVAVGAVLTGVALIWLGRVSSLWEYYLAFGVVAALGYSLCQLVPLTAIVTHWFLRHRGLALGLVTTGQGVGQIAVPLFQYGIEQIGWRQTYQLTGLAIFVVPAVLALLFLHSRPESRGDSIENERMPWGAGKQQSDEGADGKPRREPVVLDTAWAETDWTIASAVRTSRFWSLTLVMTFYSVGFMMILVQIFAYLTDEGYPAMLAASAVSVQGVLNIFGKIYAGELSDRIGREKTFTLSISAYLTSLLLLAAAGTWYQPALVYLFAAFYGLGTGMSFPTLLASTGDIFQGPTLGKIFGVVGVGGLLGAALGAWLGGFLFDHFGSYDSHLIAAPGMMITSVALLWYARPGAIRAVQTVR